MVIVIARQTLKPGKKAELFALAKDVIAATRKEEKCISYELLDDPYADNRCAFVEKWVDKEALAEHLKTPHLTAWRQKSANLLAEKTTIELYQSEEISF
ncbi:Quinol monooxygenase YgiN [Pelosinus fermentans]|uniref:putative quinol monooxygenase n=1 Tax=Pelosinus fermentans TaxID=365349 RepID=UPI0002685F9A|nr:putative quinol monooxygenase [Pelosinus fermentans]OAM92273.1 Antibiotic biosynthesis monooxygenase [Pelosinus fermentans DSM 17108]SDQ39182.1 Quinol monooxygenase YgiN [Pelosinus fermentans]